MTIDHSLVGCEIEFEKERNQRRIELFARALGQLLKDILAVHRGPVGTVGAHGIEGIRQGDESRHEGDVVAGKSVRIPAAVPAFMVVEDSLDDVLEARDVSEDPVADPWMFPDRGVLRSRQIARLAQQLLRDADLAHIVDQTRDVHPGDGGLVEARRMGKLPCQRCHSSGVTACARSLASTRLSPERSEEHRVEVVVEPGISRKIPRGSERQEASCPPMMRKHRAFLLAGDQDSMHPTIPDDWMGHGRRTQIGQACCWPRVSTRHRMNLNQDAEERLSVCSIDSVESPGDPEMMSSGSSEPRGCTQVAIHLYGSV